MQHSALFKRVSSGLLIALLFWQLALGADGHFLNFRQPLVYGLAAWIPALTLAAFYWNGGDARLPSRAMLCGWIISAVYHAGVGWIFAFQGSNLKCAWVSAAASLLSIYLAIVRNQPSRSGNEIEKTPRSEGERLYELRSVAILFLLWATLNLAITATHREKFVTITESGAGSGWSFEQTYHLPLELSDFGILAFVGLWLRWPAIRKFAVFLSWCWLIGGSLLLMQLFSIARLTASSNDEIMARIPEDVLRVFVFPFLLAQIWQLRVLKRGDIIELFERPSKLLIGELKGLSKERA